MFDFFLVFYVRLSLLVTFYFLILLLIRIYLLVDFVNCLWLFCLNGGHGRIIDALPVIEVVGGLTVLYQRRVEYKSYFYDFQRNIFPRKCCSTKGFYTKIFPWNAGKAQWEKSEEALATHSFCGAYCTATYNWYFSILSDKQYRYLNIY